GTTRACGRRPWSSRSPRHPPTRRQDTPACRAFDPGARPTDLLAAFLDVRLDELFRVLLEDGVDLVEELVQLALEVRGVDAVPDRPVLDGLGPWAVVALRLFAHPFHVAPVLSPQPSVGNRVDFIARGDQISSDEGRRRFAYDPELDPRRIASEAT